MNLLEPDRRVIAVVAGDHHFRGEIRDSMIVAISEAFSPAEINSGGFDWSRAVILISGARTSGGRHVLGYAEQLGMGIEHHTVTGYSGDRETSMKAIRLIRRKPAALLVVGNSSVGTEALASARRNNVPVITCGLKKEAA